MEREQPSPEVTELTDAVALLSRRVQRLGEQLSVSRRQAVRMRVLSGVTAFLTVLSLLGVLTSIMLWRGVRETAHDTEAAQVQTCRNNNDARAANNRLWTFILDVSEASNPIRPEQKRQIDQLRTWVNALYAPRDCSDLNRSYPIPDPPPILKRR